MSRSSWKPLFIDPKLWNISSSTRVSEQDFVCTKRSTHVKPFRVGRRIHISNGIRLIPSNITAERVGHRLGEFAITRKRSSTNLKQNPATKK